ncbi:MAG: ABC transporter ATP-binding protein [Planctomycetota bacterium]
MPVVDARVSCQVHDSFRVQQVAGMFDVPLAKRAAERFSVELPGDDEAWDIGLIVGPSGSGKSTVARRRYGAALDDRAAWPRDKAVIDAFGEAPTRKIIELLTAVGFSSPPSWIKPYHALSCGEQFRCDLARALAIGFGHGSTDDRDATRTIVAFDEFTSVVDRHVAKACSAAIAKGVRSGALAVRLVAVTCHYDVAPWLEPDWTLDMATKRLDRRRLRRPSIDVQIHRCGRTAWNLFARHHYLSGALAQGARCYLAVWHDQPVTFCATTTLIGKRRHRRVTRVVTLPDYQGLGVGMRVVAAVASLHRREGLRLNITGSHPSVVRHCQRSPLWKTVCVKKTGASARSSRRYAGYVSSAGRAVVSFEYVGD